jgi:hypothetical protein
MASLNQTQAMQYFNQNVKKKNKNLNFNLIWKNRCRLLVVCSQASS